MPIPRKLLIPLVSVSVILVLGIYHVVGAGKVYRVKEVFDGDTILLDDKRKVRLIGVDAPEVQSIYRDEEPFGKESKAYLSSLVENREVVVIEGDPPLDRYGRTLAYICLGDVLVNGRIIRDGWARAYRIYYHPWRDLFIAYEREARSKGLGLWKK